MNELDVLQDEIVTYIQARRFFALPLPSGRYRTGGVEIMTCPVGTASILAAVNNHHFFLQLKKSPKEIATWHKVVESYLKTGFASPAHYKAVHQFKFKREAEKQNIQYHLVSSLEDVERLINNLIK